MHIVYSMVECTTTVSISMCTYKLQHSYIYTHDSNKYTPRHNTVFSSLREKTSQILLLIILKDMASA